ncbi:hypothetical protein ACRN9C_05440 [Shewanella frigidimarina]|uniref:hypothetical protein n=1 Tax=Shewanella frigidimarina TaxID=56812 RepID=UPI003D7AEC68
MLSGAATSLALESFEYCAGLASSIDGFMRMVGGGLLVLLFGYLGLSSVYMLAAVYMLSIFALMLVLFTKLN